MGVTIVDDSEIALAVYTVGHSTHTLERFACLLRGAGVERVVDVRRAPQSRRMPHFGKAELERSLPDRGIDYVHAPELGGFRRAASDSPNGGWRVAAFRGYADYMRTPTFATALARLIAWASERPTAAMCAEALWYRCHRRLIADALTIRGFEVRHIASDGSQTSHELPPFAVVDAAALTYPPSQGTFDVR